MTAVFVTIGILAGILVFWALVFASRTPAPMAIEAVMATDVKPTGKIPVIIHSPKGLGLKHRVSARLLGGKVKEDFPVINSFSADIPLTTLKLYARIKGIAWLAYDEEVSICLDVAKKTTKATQVWPKGYTGKGVTIAIVDTGIYPHPDLTQPVNRIIGFKDLVKGKTKPYDDNGHGTHVAGDAAGNGKSYKGRYRGSAPEAKLVGVKVLDKYGSGSTSKVIAGIQWVISNKDKYKIRIMNLSLGVDTTTSYKTHPLCLAVEAAWKAGIVVLAAAGNSGPKAGTINAPGIDPFIITVGAEHDQSTASPTGDIIAYFSSRGPTSDGFEKPDIVAPGVYITSLNTDAAYIPTLTLDKIAASENSEVEAAYVKTQSFYYYKTLSGTSMATPIAAGIVALLLQKYPALKPDEVKSRVRNSAHSLGFDVNSQGAGLIQADKLLNQ